MEPGRKALVAERAGLKGLLGVSREGNNKKGEPRSGERKIFGVREGAKMARQGLAGDALTWWLVVSGVR